METRRRVIFGGISSFLLFLSVFLFRFLELSTRKAMLFSLRLPNTFMKLSGSLTFKGVVFALFFDLSQFVLAFVPIALSFAVLAFYGMNYDEDKELALISLAPPAIAGCVLSSFTFPSISLYSSILVGGFLITGLGETYSEELDRWSNFRVGTSSLGKVFLILSVFLTVGIFLHTVSDVKYYKSEYRNSTREIIMEFTNPKELNVTALSEEEMMKQLPEKYREYLNSLPKEQRKKVLSELKSKTGSQLQKFSLNARKVITNRFLESEKFSSLVDFVLFLTVLAIGGLLLFLRKIFYGPIAGLVTLISRFT